MDRIDNAALNDAKAELTADREEYRAVRAAAGLPTAKSDSTQRKAPMLPPAAGLSATERRDAIRKYDAELNRQREQIREAAFLKKITQKRQES